MISLTTTTATKLKANILILFIITIFTTPILSWNTEIINGSPYLRANMSDDAYNGPGQPTGLRAPFDTVRSPIGNYYFPNRIESYLYTCDNPDYIWTNTPARPPVGSKTVLIPKGASITFNNQFINGDIICIAGTVNSVVSLVTKILFVVIGGTFSLDYRLSFTPATAPIVSGIVSVTGTVVLSSNAPVYTSKPINSTVMCGDSSAGGLLYNSVGVLVSNTPINSNQVGVSCYSGNFDPQEYYTLCLEQNIVEGGQFVFTNDSDITISNRLVSTSPLTTIYPYNEPNVYPAPNPRFQNGLDVIFGAKLSISNCTILGSSSTNKIRALINTHHASLSVKYSKLVSNAANLILTGWGTESVYSENNLYFSKFAKPDPVPPNNYTSFDYAHEGHIISLVTPDFVSINDRFGGNMTSIYNLLALKDRSSVTGYNYDFHLPSQLWRPSYNPIFTGPHTIIKPTTFATVLNYFTTINSEVPGTVYELQNITITQPLYLNVPAGAVILKNVILNCDQFIIDGLVNYLEISGSTITSNNLLFAPTSNVKLFSIYNTTISAPGGIGNISTTVDPFQPIFNYQNHNLVVSSYQPLKSVETNTSAYVELTVSSKDGSPLDTQNLTCVFSDASSGTSFSAPLANGTCNTAFNLTLGTYRFVATVKSTIDQSSLLSVTMATINFVNQTTSRFYLGYNIGATPSDTPTNVNNLPFITGCNPINCTITNAVSSTLPQYDSGDPNFIKFDYGLMASDIYQPSSIRLRNIPRGLYQVTLYFVYFKEGNQVGTASVPSSFSAQAGESSSSWMIINNGGLISNQISFNTSSVAVNSRVLDSKGNTLDITWLGSSNIYLTALTMYSDYDKLPLIPTPTPTTSSSDSSTNPGGKDGDDDGGFKLLPLVIVLPAVAAVALILLAAALFRKKRRYRSRQMDIEMQSAARSQLTSSKSENIDDNRYNLHSEVFNSVQQSHYYSPDHESFPLVFSTTRLDFSVGNSKCQIDQKMTDQIIIKNNTDQNLNIQLIFPLSTSARTIYCKETEIILKKGRILAVDVDVTLHCTTKLMEKFAVVIEGYGHTFLYMHLESVLSTHLDFQEIKFGAAIGSGGFGSVFKCKWRGLDVAVKCIRTRFCNDDIVREVERECDLMNRLRHPNIVNYFGTARHEGDFFLVSEYIPLGSIANVVYKMGRALTMNEIIRVCLDTAKGTNFLHQSGIMHRDLKPDNLLMVSLSPDSPVCIKLTDFGTSKEVNSMGTENATSGIGTPIYMAPEILLKRPYGTQADVYSFGIMLYELVIGEIPFSEFTANWEIPSYILKGDRPTKGMEKAPEPIKQLIEECWKGEPDERPTFNDIIPRLEQLLPEFPQPEGVMNISSMNLLNSSVNSNMNTNNSFFNFYNDPDAFNLAFHNYNNNNNNNNNNNTTATTTTTTTTDANNNNNNAVDDQPSTSGASVNETTTNN